MSIGIPAIDPIHEDYETDRFSDEQQNENKDRDPDEREDSVVEDSRSKVGGFLSLTVAWPN
jgi:hypothetical protein